MGAMDLLYHDGLLLREREPTAPDFEATQLLPIADEMRKHELRCLGPHGSTASTTTNGAT
jgi:hypothetical protein